MNEVWGLAICSGTLPRDRRTQAKRVIRTFMPPAALWRYSGSAADRMWHKSAIGRPAGEGQLELTPAETLFVHYHRHIELPSDNWLDGALSANSELMQEYAVLEALRVPGNKVVLAANLDIVGVDSERESWALRWASDAHPRDSAPAAEIRWFHDSDSLDAGGLLDWAERVGRVGRVAEVLVVDAELSVVTYRVSSSEPRGVTESSGVLETLRALAGGGIPSAGGRLFSADSWKIQQLGVPTEAGVHVDEIAVELIEGFTPQSDSARILADLLLRGLVMRPGFKYGTRWRCYDKPLGQDHAPWLVILPSEAPRDWGGACLASRLAAGVNKVWLHPISRGDSWAYLAVKRPPADSRWSNPNRR